ncbi:MAG TPA: site-specific DNA-methyltransferase, partial [Agitococcus sp.]|nr:site-specific DNA-methyltransferase [Agitococcus sp.]
NRQFICVQLDEKTDPKKEANKAGYQSIFDITQARIQKAAQKIQTDNPNYTGDLGFKLFKTVPIFDNYQQPIAQFAPNQELFDGTQLSPQDLANLLTTWQLQHNIPLSQTLNTIDLGGYTAHWFNDTLYLMAQGFDSPHLNAFIQKLDTDNSFTITKLIMFGYNINSKMQREIDEGLKNYRNKKSITLDVVVKY